MDIIILKHLKNNYPTSGYDVIKLLHHKFHMLPSPGTVYSILYSLERQNLIEGDASHGKRLYKLTDQGKTLLNELAGTGNRLQITLSSIFSEY
jgi:DNA-binding PadR family transcriptional regulator